MNEFVRVFFDLVTAPDPNPKRCITNWAPWPSGRSDRARRCRYPKHDDHLLRTAIRPKPTTIITEDKGLLETDRCIYLHFRVHIRLP